MILKLQDIQEDVLRAYRDGWGSVYNLGFKNLSPFYNIVEGSCTDWTGYPASGKTELLIECIKNCAEWYGHRYLLYMPDSGSVVELIAKLAHKISGKQFEEFYFDKYGNKVAIENRLTEKEIYNLLPMIFDMFAFYQPKNNKGRRVSVTPLEFWNYAAKNKSNLNLFGAVADSWNHFKHDITGFHREDKWLEYTLSERNQIAEESGLHLHTVIHPKSERKDKNGVVLIPDMHSLKGGSEWANNGKSIVVVHREFGSTITDVKIAKAKPRIVGRQGLVSFQLDLKSGSYYQLNDMAQREYATNPLGSEGLKIEPNEAFDKELF